MTTHRQPAIGKGRIVINNIHPVALHEDVQVWEMDCASKYPAVYAGIASGDGITPDRHEVHLTSTDQTLYVDESKSRPTVVTFTPGKTGEHWNTVLDYGRYSVRVVLYRSLAGDALVDGNLVWHAESDGLDDDPNSDMILATTTDEGGQA